MCQNVTGSGLQNWVDTGPIAAQCGLSKIHFFQRNIWILTKGAAVDYKSKMVQAMAWRRADTKQLAESVVIEVNCAHMRLSGSLSWLLLHHEKMHRYNADKNGTGRAHEGYLHSHSWRWAIPNRQVGSGRGTGWPYFVKSPVAGEIGMLPSATITMTRLWKIPDE